MNLSKEQIQRQEFKGILFSLSFEQFSLRDEDDRTYMFHRLENLYNAPLNQNGFRHFYSDIYWVLMEIKQGYIRDGKQADINTLGQNIAEIRAEYSPQNESKDGKLIDISESIRKLYDHVSLEIAQIISAEADRQEIKNMAFFEKLHEEFDKEIFNMRHEYMTTKRDVEGTQKQIEDRQSKMEKDLNDANVAIVESTGELTKAKTELNDAKNKVEGLEKEYIAILGIFSSVVLTFTAGIAFSTSVLENIHQTSVYRLVLGVLLIAFVLINVIFLLFHYVDKMVHGEDTKGLTFIKWIDLAMVVAMGIVVVSWFFGFVEWRNTLQEDNPTPPTIANITEEQLEEKIEEILKKTMKNNVDVDITISGELQEAQSQEIPVTGE